MPYQWSESLQRFLYANGKVVPQQMVNNVLDRALRATGDRMRQISVQLQEGTISLATWQTQMLAEMKPLYTGAAAYGRGGWAQMSQADWGWTGQKIRTQYGFFNQFVQAVATGHQPMDGRLLVRTTLYAEAARGIQREMQRRTSTLIGREEERNRLGGADRHCATCLECSARGWVPIGTLPPIGSRTCMSRCRCSLMFRDRVADAA